MNKKHNESHNQIQNQEEVAVFLNHILQWICDLQYQDVELFEEQKITELGQAIARKFELTVFYDFDRNYSNAYSLKILIDGKGKASLMPKDPDYYAALKVSQFEVVVDISRVGGFFCLHSHSISTEGNTSFKDPVQKKSKNLHKIYDQIARFLMMENGLVQIPDVLLKHQINGRNTFGGEVTVYTQLFRE